MAKKKILIIDDEPNIIKMVEVRLKANNYDVVAASDGAEGLEKAKAEHPDLIILDVMMPGVDGFQFFKTIRKDPAQANTPILMLTARGAMKDTFEMLGAEEFITKPFESEDLLLKINHMFKNSALVLSNDSYVADRVTNALRDVGYEVTVVSDEEGLAEKGREVKYRVIVAHLRCVAKQPADFAMSIRMLRERNPQVIIYSDADTKPKDNSALAAVKDAWAKAGVKHIFDVRTADRPLPEFIKSVVS
ncbi:MAG TPA: response regulator [Patescibacteria group bacterium]|nr:response regulator [Patescibacteria group bacterium]